jgi:hypothetical protein
VHPLRKNINEKRAVLHKGNPKLKYELYPLVKNVNKNSNAWGEPNANFSSSAQLQKVFFSAISEIELKLSHKIR